MIVGAGFAGSVLAERLKSIGKKVLIVEKRSHAGGNCYDYHDTNGVLIHKYGPHYFRTDYDVVRDYLSKFTEWHPVEYRVKACVNGRLFTIPINRETLNDFFNENLKTEREAEEFLSFKKLKIDLPKNAEEQVLSLAGKEIYDAFFKNYTLKQWGVDPKCLCASVTARIPIRTNRDDRYFTSKFQAIPKHGYHALFSNLLENIPILLNTRFESIKDYIQYDKLIYTGLIDEFFNYKFGELPYRSLKFKFEQYNKEFYQKWSQINYPNDYDFTRIVEIKHVTGQNINKTTIVKECPCSEGEPYYPIPVDKNYELYKKYKAEAEKLENIYFIGRLAQYEYLNMDEVVKRALELFEVLKNE